MYQRNCFSCDGRRTNNSTGITGPATVTWTSVTTGNPVSRGDAISLYITPGITASTVYSIFLITDI